MEIYQIRQLLAVARCGTLSAAAGVLNISQPALSRSMQRLERELGVPLFDRTRNRIELNEAGRLAVEQGEQVLRAVEGMTARMRDHARAQTTISLGSCAPGPMWTMTPGLALAFPDRTISSEMRPVETLIEGLLSGTYQIVILDRPLDRDGVLCRGSVRERLYVSLPASHPLSEREGLYLSELAGQTMLLYADLGVWERLREEKMGGIRFIVQREREAFLDLVSASPLPNFTTDLTRRLRDPPPDRVEIPILDPEASIRFYLCASERDRRLLDRISGPAA